MSRDKLDMLWARFMALPSASMQRIESGMFAWSFGWMSCQNRLTEKVWLEEFLDRLEKAEEKLKAAPAGGKELTANE